jgi:hypothetical protein
LIQRNKGIYINAYQYFSPDRSMTYLSGYLIFWILWMDFKMMRLLFFWFLTPYRLFGRLQHFGETMASTDVSIRRQNPYCHDNLK